MDMLRLTSEILNITSGTSFNVCVERGKDRDWIKCTLCNLDTGMSRTYTVNSVEVKDYSQTARTIVEHAKKYL